MAVVSRRPLLGCGERSFFVVPRRLTQPRDPATGLALGTASHGIGTARALQVREVAGAFSGLAMGLNALATALLLPLLWGLLF